MNKYIRYFVIHPIIIYFSLLLLLYVSQKSMVYIPDSKPFENCITFEKSEQKYYNNTRFYEQRWETDDLIVFFHWNAWRACDRSYMKSLLESSWNSIIFPEYFWYADNNTPSKKDILKDVENIWEYVKNSNYKNTYIIWRSVWTGPASYFAKNYKTDKLILISPYSSLYKIWADKYPFFPIKLLFTENYSPESYLKNYNNDLLIIHWKKTMLFLLSMV